LRGNSYLEEVEGAVSFVTALEEGDTQIPDLDGVVHEIPSFACDDFGGARLGTEHRIRFYYRGIVAGAEDYCGLRCRKGGAGYRAGRFEVRRNGTPARGFLWAIR
jgi:hypothetical protein